MRHDLAHTCTHALPVPTATAELTFSKTAWQKKLGRNQVLQLVASEELPAQRALPASNLRPRLHGIISVNRRDGWHASSKPSSQRVQVLEQQKQKEK